MLGHSVKTIQKHSLADAMSRESGTVRQAVPKKTSRAKQLIVKLTLWQFKSLEILIQDKKFTLVADILPGQCSIAECSVWENSQSNGPALELPHLTSPSSRDVKAKSTAAAKCQNMKPKTKSCTVTSLQNPWFFFTLQERQLGHTRIAQTLTLSIDSQRAAQSCALQTGWADRLQNMAGDMAPEDGFPQRLRRHRTVVS